MTRLNIIAELEYFFLVPVPVCPHAGGVGLCEMVQHLQIWDYICVSGTTKGRLIEYVNHLSEHFKTPSKIVSCHYIAPKVIQYSECKLMSDI